MASPAALALGELPQDSPPDSACKEAQKWIEQVTGRSFGDKDFRTGLENGILLCELLNAIKPGLVKKINRLPTPIAGLDNITLFLRGCKELGLKESQLFDPGDLQDTSNRTTVRASDCNRKLRNVLVTVYWLGKTANSCISYSGNQLDLKEFEGLLAQMRKENEELESPKRSIRDSGYVDCWDSERSDSLSPPRHGRDDSFDSLDSFGSRSQQTPSPDVVLRGSSDGRGSDSESDLPHRRLPDVRKDDMSARRVSFGENKAFVPFNQYLPNKSNPTTYIPAPLRKKKAEREDYRKSWSTATSPLGGERPFRSMSMCDMRYEEEGGMLPHSRAHQDHLQTINDQLKEEDETWQDDLAKWKTRRRSTSQDLIKRDQERKKMERLLSGEGSDSERRKSIKTYKEIVEEKERRERELHEAYKNAKTKEEAEKILQKYIERFTISEAVLERIVMPKILERSSSVEPSLLASSEEPNPLKYLRQQSLPSPKYTSTVEATISPSSESDHKIVSGQISPSKNVISKAVPMLTAKPYSQPKTTQEVLKTFKVDGRSSLNGEACNGMEDQKVGGCGNLAFAPPLTRSQLFEGKARVDDMSTVKKQDIACIELSLTKTDMQDSVRQMKDFTGTVNHDGHRDELTPDVKTEVQSVQQCLEGTENPVTINQVRSSISSLEFTPLIPLKEIAVNGKVSEKERQIPVDCDSKEQNKSALVPLKDTNEPTKTSQLNLTITIRNSCRCSQIFYPSGGTGYNRVSPAVTPTLTSPSRFCAWDPEEERRRQERWQQEQEKRLQERYQKEQEKLKEEWEKAQKEVEEEERKYYEEEKKIIEDTVMPLTVPPVASGHLSVPEKNGSLGSAEKKDGNQEKNAGKDCIELQESSKDCVQTGEIRKPQTLSWKQEETNHRAEEAIKRLETDEWVIVEKESEQQNHVPLNECNPAAKSNLQADRQVTSPEIHLPVDETSPSSFLDGRTSPMITRGTDGQENMRGVGYPSQSSTSQCQSPNRSVSGKKLCSTCGHPLGKGAAMIIETLSLYFHIQCFKCGICKGQLGDATTGTDVRIRNGLLNCNDCYVRSRTAGHPTPL
uniref:LIM and calponin homology domains 1 n=1 Tax=Leptobrachium leishanense TaxID=445787 RepID=A0A8C5PQY2_9ANUR